MANIKEAFEYASQNPTSDFAKNLEQLAKSGALNEEAKKYGIDLSGFQQETQPEVVEKKPFIQRAAEKVADFTGGKELAQAGAVALAKPFVSKQIDETQAMQGDIQGRLIQRIKEKKALGEDTTRLEDALGTLTAEIQDFGAGADKLLNPNNLTPEQVKGDALQLAGTAVGGKVAGAVAGKATGATSVLKGIGQGAVTGGATGAIGGGITGASQAMQENKDTSGVVKDAVTGAVVGGVGGAALGGLTGGIAGGLKGRALKKANEYLDAVTPNAKDLTPTEYTELLNKGKILPKSGKTPAQYILSDQEKEVALKYKDILTKDPVKNTENILNEIVKKDAEVGQFLEKNNGIFNTGELKNSLTEKLASIDDLTVDEKRLLKLKKATIDNFIKSLGKNDMKTLWTARKEFDRSIEKAFSGSPTLQGTIKKEFRNGIQDFIIDRTPDDVYRTAMKDMAQLYNLKDIVNTKAVKEKGMNAIQLWIKNNPNKTSALKWLGGTGIVGTIGYNALKN